MAWYNEKGNDNNLVISTRVRLARNLKEFPFPNMMKNEDFIKLLRKIRKTYEDNDWLRQNFIWIDLENTPLIERQKLVEKHLISPDMLNHPKGRAIILKKDEKISIMLNEEDHIRIQSILAGLDPENAYKMASKVDDIISSDLMIAYSGQFGFLTSCPTNTGTGLRASVMLHLPALMESGYMEQLLAAVSRMGIAVRGLYGEGSKAVGNLFQVSNQVTLGLTENDIINRLKEIIQNIIKKEQELRRQLISSQKDKITDRVLRSYGIMQYAHMLTSHELLNLVSDVRIGSDLGIFKIEDESLDQLIVDTSPAHIAAVCGDNSNAEQRDKKRAEIVKKLKIKR